MSSCKKTFKCGKCGYCSLEQFSECPQCHSKSDLTIHLEISDNLVLHECLSGKTNEKVGKKKKSAFEFKHGDDSSKDTKSGWAKVNRVIDRKNDKYSETVTDPDTGKVIHKCEEKLSKHYGHGSAKFTKKSLNNKAVTLIIFILSFVFFTLLVKFVDVAPIGPHGSSVGFATMNDFFRKIIGVNLILYKITDWSSLVTIPIGLVFFILGLIQLFKRKNLFKVDNNILSLGCFYLLTLITYLIFEFVVINRRPVLIDGHLEASYPSSTTVLSLTVFITAIDQVLIYVKNTKLKIGLILFLGAYSLFLVIGRLLSGVHWLTDIIGAILLSASLISFYYLLKDKINNLIKI